MAGTQASPLGGSDNEDQVKIDRLNTERSHDECDGSVEHEQDGAVPSTEHGDKSEPLSERSDGHDGSTASCKGSIQDPVKKKVTQYGCISVG